MMFVGFFDSGIFNCSQELACGHMSAMELRTLKQHLRHCVVTSLENL